MNQKQILVLFGGESSEHTVSIASAQNVVAAIDTAKYHVHLGYIDTSGKWWYLESFDQHKHMSEVKELVPVLGSQELIIGPHERIRPDVILPVLHGKNGEDGTVQGLAQLLHIPIVGCGLEASAICMDKVAAKQLLERHEIAVVPYVARAAWDTVPDFSSLKVELGEQLFIKPSRAGSSIGVSKVHNQQELDDAFKEALRHDSVVLIEKALEVREIELAVLGTPPNHQVSLPGEIAPSEEFYSFNAKYGSSSEASQVMMPASLSKELTEEAQAIASSVYEILGCEGLARVDLFLAGDTFYVNEVNTFPGFTNISLYPKAWEYQGVGYTELISMLIENAFDRHATINADK